MEYRMNIYVGNMSFATTEEQVRHAFEGFGAVSTVRLITDRETGKPKGFGFVEMLAINEANAAIGAMNGRELNGRALSVNEAKPRGEGGARDTGNREGSNGYRKVY